MYNFRSFDFCIIAHRVLLLLFAAFLLLAQTSKLEQYFELIRSQKTRADTDRIYAAFEDIKPLFVMEDLSGEMPALTRALSDSNTAVRKSASGILRAISTSNKNSRTVIGALIGLLVQKVSDQDSQVRENNASTLALLQPTPPNDLTKSFMEFLRNSDSTVRQAGAYGLLRIRPITNESSASIEMVLKEDVDLSLKSMILDSIIPLSVPQSFVARYAVISLNNVDKDLQAKGVRLIESLDKIDKENVSKLQAVLASPQLDPKVRQALQAALERLGQK